MSGLSQEIEILIHDKHDAELSQKKLAQLRKLTRALVCLYVAGILFALAALIMDLPGLPVETLNILAKTCLCLGVLALIIALGFLILFSLHAVKIKQEQFK